MPRFFCDAIAGGKAVITGEDAAHIARSLRMQPGERLTLSDGQGTDFDCVLDLVTPQEVFLTVLESYPCRTEPSVYVRPVSYTHLGVYKRQGSGCPAGSGCR